MSLLEVLTPGLSSPGRHYLRGDFARNPLTADEIFEGFVGWSAGRGLELYPHQEEAVLEVANGANVILATPTGSGKSMVALAAHFTGLAQGQRSYYTAPIKALVSEKFFALCEAFGAENVGMVTGDSAVNPDAPIVCCTAEILANIALREGPGADLGPVVMDEFHFFADPQRGWAWQVPLVELPQAQFLLMSATLGDTSAIRKRLTEATGRETAVVDDAERPVPLSYYYSELPVHEQIDELVSTHQAPVYVVHFSQLQAMDQAQSLMSVNVLSKEEKERVSEVIADFKFAAGFGKTLNRLVRHGIGVHHAGMLPKYRRLVEQLAQEGLLKVICGTDTLGVGINVPIRTVLITALSKFDGQRTRRLQSREFHQIAGRAGRAGFDTQGTVVVQAPEHDIENNRAMEKARRKHGNDEKKLRQVPKKKPPQGFVSWSRKTFDALIASEPEPLRSGFSVTHAMLLNLLQRPWDPVAAARHLFEGLDGTVADRRRWVRESLGILRELRATGVVERLTEPDDDGRRYRLTVELQENFALNNALAPFALAALTLLDPEAENHELDAVSVIESTLERPRQVLAMQEKKAKTEALAQMKADGLEYNERMRELDDITYAMPLRELLEQAFETYRSSAPWLAEHELTPKSVVRDMFERAMTFGQYVQFYGLTRSEGILLRYLTDAYRALRQTVPIEQRTEALEDIIEWLGETIRQTDNSLLDEWEKLTRGEESPAGTTQDSLAELMEEQAPAITNNPRAFRIMVRNAMFQRVELFAQEKDKTLGALDGDAGWDRDRWAEAMDEYFNEYDDIFTDAQARGPALIRIDEAPEGLSGFWTVQQVFDDPEGNHDFGINARIDLKTSDEDGFPAVVVDNVGPITNTGRS
ncbi:DUF3516 domain-containing protein [Kocuria sp. JC486]|uniref:DUF3516 domain-containing protein n=1 Tax=Kocuria soli TaxID=2485125 RepID=A0A3N4A5A4_9MICC|nr:MULTISPECIES: DEAD/DEAH box helicase [Kocuria]NHU84048.1 DUF3516 domain-containing protein [Kocuria sp. JC486]ROZ63820.1 DUF3516 domain-containing protein [Kocuria soli]